MRQVNLVGGEPMLIRQCMDINPTPCPNSVARNIVLSITTNGMVLPEGWLELAAQFRQVTMTFSLDGYGPISEYIRYPSNWSEILENINKFKTLPNAYFCEHDCASLQHASYRRHDPVCDEMKLEFRTISFRGRHTVAHTSCPPAFGKRQPLGFAALCHAQ